VDLRRSISRARIRPLLAKTSLPLATSVTSRRCAFWATSATALVE
jgi:hypothetical protein